jgi:DNA-binding response OmpR family regulator
MKEILVVEDSKTINNIIKKELRSLGYGIAQAFTFKQARKHLNTKKFQLIILDLHLPDGEGSELIAHIQSLTKTKVIVLTSSQDEDLREELFQYGILDYIIKDANLIYSITEIIKVIHQLNSQQKDKILVIDDSKFICKQIKTILEPRNYTIRYALTAKEGFEKLEKTYFNLIILDMELPDMHGLKVLEQLRKQTKLLSIPVIVLSGTATPQIIRDVLKNGANDFLKKPFVFEEFILKVDLWIDYFKKEKELAKKTLELEKLNANLENRVQEELEKNRAKEKLLLQKSRQAQMGEMIAMIAHQWRQPLNAISIATSALTLKSKRGMLTPETVDDITQKIHNYIQHLSNTIDDFRNFFRPDKEKTETDFQTILTKALNLLDASLKKNNITIKQNISNPSSFLSYENELVQVVVNILKNAEDILVEKNISTPTISITIKHATLTIEDNANGIKQEILERIFEPYFSTKLEKNGTGLGLYMSKIIVEEHCHGSLSVRNTKKGALFEITLPNTTTQERS